MMFYGNFPEKAWEWLRGIPKGMLFHYLLRLFGLFLTGKREQNANRKEYERRMKDEERLKRGLEQVFENPAIKVLILKVALMALKALTEWVQGQEENSN